VRNGNDVAVMVQVFSADAGRAAISNRVAFAPHEIRTLRLPAHYEQELANMPDAQLGLSIMIIDSYGRVWVRSPNGVVRRLSTDERRQVVPSPVDVSAQLEWDQRA
jgi:hypothetical protein